MGSYTTSGGGIFLGGGGSGHFDISWSGNENVMDLEGWSNAVGFSAPLFGLESNNWTLDALDINKGVYPASTLSLGPTASLLFGVELRDYLVYTDINLGDESVLTYSAEAQSGAAPSDITSTRMIVEENQ